MNHLIKKLLLLAIPLVLAACTFDSDDDVEPWDADKVCPAEGTNAYGMPNRGTFTDERDGNVYRYTTIGNQVWMAENLRYDAPYSTCSNDTSFIRQYCELIEHNCETMQCCKESMCHNFGRYYSIIQNEEWFGPIDRNLTDTICPRNWHIPTKDDWEILNSLISVKGESNSEAATRMKSANSNYFAISKLYLNDNGKTYVGTDDCGLSIIPSGVMNDGGQTIESGAILLSSTQQDSSSVYTIIIRNYTKFYFQNYKNTIRCVMDSNLPE